MALLMAGRVSRVVAYLPSLRSAAKQLRASASTFSAQQTQTSSISEPSRTVWPDQVLGLLAPQDKRFPFPGLTGTDQQLNSKAEGSSLGRSKKAGAGSLTPDIITATLPIDRHAAIAEHLINTADEEVSDAEDESALHKVECVIQDCPDLLKKGVSTLFPGRNIYKEDLTVITLSQKTDNDMTGWNPDVEEEREILLAEFVDAAQEVCTTLREVGFWADFIDPSSGKPYLGPHTNDTLFETDERYQYFGFDVEDLGCCKVIRHHKWGSKCYVGSVFTNAPSTHPVLTALELSKKS